MHWAWATAPCVDYLAAKPASGNNARMPMTDRNKAFLQIHFCVLLWGFTAIFGKLISLPALPLVWWRMLIVVAVLALVPRVWRGLRAMPLRLMLSYAGIGVLVALHWLTFYGSIKLSNASVGATCIALATVFTALVEPWLARTRFSRRELALGIAVLPGVALVVGGVPAGMRLGSRLAPCRRCWWRFSARSTSAWSSMPIHSQSPRSSLAPARWH